MPRVPDREVIPIYLDDTPFVGIPNDLVGITFTPDADPEVTRDRVTDEIAFKSIERLAE
jgi:hypothetical protein